MKISVIICADSDNTIFMNCLKAVKWQQYTEFETIIVDTGLYGDREAMVREVLCNNYWYIHHEKTKRYHVEAAMNRNDAAALASGDVLFFMPDSVLTDRTTLQKLAAVFNTRQADVCILNDRYLKDIVLQPDTHLNHACYIDGYHLAKFDYKVLKNETLLREVFPWGKANLCCYAVRKTDFDACGGYDSNAGIYASSDAELIYKLRRNGCRIRFPADMAAFVQNKDRYPVVRWRASGAEYLAYKYQTEETLDWFAVKKLERDITDYNRYHKHKIMLSRRGEKALTARYAKQPGAHAIVLLVDRDLTEEILQQIRRLGTLQGSVYAISILPDDHSVMEEIMASLPEQEVKLCGWNRKEEWNDICSNLKLAAIVKLATKNKELQKYIQASEKVWLSRKSELEAAVCNELDVDISEETYQVIRVSNICEKLPELFPNDKDSRVHHLRDISVRKWDFRHFQYGSENIGCSLPPRTISFRLTYKCNLHCKMCGQWGDNGIYKDKSNAFVNQHMPIGMLKQVVDETASFCPGMYYIWGGEPMLHPDYIELIRFIKEKKIFCTTTTNGMFLKKYAKELCEIGTEFIRISIDGTEKVHNSIRGNPRCYQTVMEGIREIVRYKKAMNTTYPILECDSVIIPDNYEFIEDYIQTVSGIEGINSINFSHPIYANERVGQEQAEEYQKEFGMTSQSWNGFVMDLERVDTDKLIDIVGHVMNQRHSVPVNFDPPMRTLEDIRAHYTDIENLYKNRFCTVPWIWVEIHPDGMVSFCEDFCDYYIGDLNKQSFADIWNGEKARKYRTVLLRRNKFPICSYCGLLCHDADF